MRRASVLRTITAVVGTAAAWSAVVWSAVVVLPAPAMAQVTIDAALAQAYRNNATLNAQRAAVRATDENVPQALSGYRPRITGTADIGDQYNATKSAAQPGRPSTKTRSQLDPSGYGVTLSQTLYNGNQTTNRVRQAEAQVMAARETLRNTEQNVLLEAATAYMNVLRDTAIVSLRRQNVDSLGEQLRATRDRFQVGEVTRTDVAQAEAALAGAQSQFALAEANAATARAVFRRVIGIEAARLQPARPLDRLTPKTLDAAVGTGLSRHPSIEAAKHGADTALLQVRIAEGSLLPTVTVEASYVRRFEPSAQVDDSITAQAVARLTVPIYQGGQEYSLIRQAKETLGQRRIEVDVARDQVRAAVVQSWFLITAARAQIEASEAQVRAAEVAVAGVREEARVGQRTTLDVLNAQTALVDARVALVTAQRDRVVGSYSLAAAIGRLSAQTLNLKVEEYEPEIHYQQVRDRWFGLRTPDGR